MDVYQFLWIFSQFILLFILLLSAYWYLSVPKELPPGSAGLPIVGYIPFLSQYVHLKLQKLGKKYGNIFHLYFGNRLVVILNDYNSIYEAFIVKGDVFSGRGMAETPPEKQQNNGIFMADGKYWKEHRRFVINYIKETSSSLEPTILNEIQLCINNIQSYEGKAFNFQEAIAASVANVVIRMVTKQSFDQDHPAIQAFVQRGKANFPVVNWADYFPVMSNFMESIQKLSLKTKQNTFMQTIKHIIDTLKLEFNDGLESNFVFKYLTEMRLRNTNQNNDHIFTDISLFEVTREFLVAGFNSNTVFLQWGILLMIKYPEIQETVQKEIDEIIGKNREPSYEDRMLMPYTEATMMEIHRFTSFIPLGVQHRTTANVFLHGYLIPKNTIVLPNLYAVHHDPQVWVDPHVFRPERFLNERMEVINHQLIIPFSIGKRACAGMTMAKTGVFLFFVSLLQYFSFKSPSDEEPELIPKPGISLKPKHSIVCANTRHF